MRFNLHIFLYLSLFFASIQSKAFCVQNFNLYGPIYAMDIDLRTELVGRDLLGQNPQCEVIHFQEIWNKPQIKQTKLIYKDFYKIIAPNEKYKIGLMSLYKSTVLSEETHRFNINNDDGILDSIRAVSGVYKAFHISTVNIEGEEIYFINTHLHPTSSEVRLTQILDILNWRLTHLDRKVILTGDFNSHYTSVEASLIRHLTNSFDAVEMGFKSYPKYFCTYCRSNHRSWKLTSEVLDYIWVSNVGGTSRQLVSKSAKRNLTGDINFTYSDHFGIQVQLDFISSKKIISENELKEKLDSAYAVSQKIFSQLRNSNKSKYRNHLLMISELQNQIVDRQGPFYELLKN